MHHCDGVVPEITDLNYFSFPFNISAKLARKLYGYLRREVASIRIQKHVRAHRARMNYTSSQASAIVIQSGLRATAARNEDRYRRQTKASIKIQVKTAVQGVSNTKIDHDVHIEIIWNPKYIFALRRSSTCS